MNKKLKDLLAGKQANHIFPFFWLHGEDPAVLRHYMQVIFDTGCRAVCLESRPHPDFLGPKWWADLDVILEEARRRSMQVWILDDRHFPTGYANGALKNAPASLCRQSVFCNETDYAGEARTVCADITALCRPPQLEMDRLATCAAAAQPPQRAFDDDRLLSVTAVSRNAIIDLTAQTAGDRLIWKKPAGDWKLCVCGLSRNCGPHRDYINMMDKASCQILIDTVYEPHYKRYSADFGKTVAGFFSDEPELGNGILYMKGNAMGTKQDLPWSMELESALAERLGRGWEARLPLLWNEQRDRSHAPVRFLYMDLVTRLVQQDFSEPIGAWCRSRGVSYIGHLIEAEHCRTASSLGHYFRGLSGQDMAGIDDIGGQVLPQGEDAPLVHSWGRARNGTFCHYGLAALGASAAAIEPRKKGRAMCEIFGNYGWEEGVRLELYLADHFLVRGINNFVPHAFSPKPYPDPDCPPHFYAQGNNP